MIVFGVLISDKVVWEELGRLQEKFDGDVWLRGRVCFPAKKVEDVAVVSLDPVLSRGVFIILGVLCFLAGVFGEYLFSIGWVYTVGLVLCAINVGFALLFFSGWFYQFLLCLRCYRVSGKFINTFISNKQVLLRLL